MFSCREISHNIAWAMWYPRCALIRFDVFEQELLGTLCVKRHNTAVVMASCALIRVHTYRPSYILQTVTCVIRYIYIYSNKSNS